jgi:hypothetical protein
VGVNEAMRKIWFRKAKSVRDAEQFDQDYYAKMSSSERLATMQFLRETWIGFKKGVHAKSRKRLQRVFKVIKQA